MTSQLSHQVEYDQNVARVHLTGEIDLAVADQLYELLVSAAGQRPGLALQVDMKAVTFTDSSGVHALVRSRARILAGGGELRLINVSGMTARVLHITGVYSYLCDDQQT